jgi:hypothetical protein
LTALRDCGELDLGGISAASAVDGGVRRVQKSHEATVNTAEKVFFLQI